MNSNVRVTADSIGQVVIPSQNNPEWGHIRVEQESIHIDESGFGRKKKLSALIVGTIADLKSFGWSPNMEIPGKIIVKEQLKPFNMKDPSRDYKIAGSTKVVCKINGAPIYRKCIYVQNPDATDVYITDVKGERMFHDNIDEIRAALAEEAESSIGNM